MIKILTIQVKGCEDCPYCKEEIWNGHSTNIPAGMICELKDPNPINSDSHDYEDPLDVLEDNGYPIWCPLLPKGDEENDQDIKT